MDYKTLDNPVLIFSEFFKYLHPRGFAIGVDHYLRLHLLLQKINYDCRPQDLKTLLCPIIAINKDQQEQFYKAFDEYFAIFQPSTPPIRQSSDISPAHGNIDKKPSQLKPRKWPYILASVFLITIAFFIALSSLQRTSGENSINVNSTDATKQSPTPTSPKPGNSPNVENRNKVEAIEQERLYQRYKTPISWTLIFTPIIFFLVYEWYSYSRRKLVLQKQYGKKPPFVWPIRIESNSLKLYTSQQFYEATRLMRKRQSSDFYCFDIGTSVNKTIKSLGFPNFHYRLGTKPPEYLVLIEKASPRDHKAKLFDELSKALQSEGLHVIRYFYDKDPRVCYGDSDEHHFQLTALSAKYADYRLLIFGDGERLIEPITGKLSSWTKIFNEWHDRALLTPTPADRWGLQEISLARQFNVLPATIDSLPVIVDCFESSVAIDIRNWIKNGTSRRFPTNIRELDNVKLLKADLGEDVFQWLCMCAVYPELQWDLTLYLGSLPSMGKNLINEANLLKLARLPWFQNGFIPDDLRWQLIQELDRNREKEARRAIIDLLEKHAPPKETFAEDEYQLNLVVQRWLYSRNRKRRREIMKVINNLPQTKTLQDYTLIRYLETSSSSPLSLILPSRLRKLFYRNSLPAFGLRTGIRFLCTIVIASFIWIAFKLPASIQSSDTNNPSLINISGTPTPSTNTNTTVNTNANTSATPVDKSAARVQVIAIMNLWADSLNRRDLYDNLSFYADYLDTYYTQVNISKETVRSYRQQSFKRYYSSVDVQLNNMQVSFDSSGSTATVKCTNTYDWRGGTTYLRGKSDIEIVLSKINGQWLITSEKHLYSYNEEMGN